jgi:ferrous iron transport protein B
MIVAVNMLDIAASRHISVDLQALSDKLGCKVYGMSATNKNDIERMKGIIVQNITEPCVPTVHVGYPLDVDQWIDAHMQTFSRTAERYGVSERWVALQVLERSKLVMEAVERSGESTKQTLTEAIMCAHFADSPEVLIAESRYQYIQNITDIVTTVTEKRRTRSDMIDSVFLNRIFGIPAFLVMMYFVFWATLAVGGSFIDFFDISFGAIFVDGSGRLLSLLGSPQWLIAIVSSGVGAGIQTVSTFVPIVFVMFMCLSVLEDSGYMARAAFVMDRFMRAIGLPGKSFVPMLVGFGCTVPAIMATRTLESSRDRILTTFMAPFMSCGARLPAYALFGAAFFGAGAGVVVFSIYLAGAALAILTGLLMKNTLLKGAPSHFILELPPYHKPKLTAILRHAWNRTRSFIIRSGKVIIVSVALLGFLNSIELGDQGDMTALSAIGAAVVPVFEPMGVEEDNWPAVVALFTGIFAKESIVGTLNSIYAQTGKGYVAPEAVKTDFDLLGTLLIALKTIPANMFGADSAEAADSVDDSLFASMRLHFSQGAAQIYAYLLFILLYVPCIAAMGAAVHEIGAKLAVVLASYLTLLAWIVATLVYQIGIAHQPMWIAIPLIMLVLIAFCLRLIGQSEEVRKAIGTAGGQ